MLKKIAITGNLGSGKSEALKIFKKLGSFIVDADKIAHDLLENDEDLKNRTKTLLGNEIFENGKIDRKKIAKIVFSNDDKLKKFEKLIHPKILNEIENFYEKVKNQNFEFFVVEIPLLFEIKGQSYFDIVITISIKDMIAKKRYKDKDYNLRIKKQMPNVEKEKLSDFVIENNQSISALEYSIKKLSKTIKNL